MPSTIVIWIAGLAAIAGLVATGYDALKRPGDISNPSAAFEAADKPAKGPKKEKVKTANWPIFGRDLARTKNLNANVGPPLRKIWSWDSKALMEFGPIVVDGRLYGLNNDGIFFALDADSGKVRWKKRPVKLNATSPAYHKGILYSVTLAPARAFALRARDGKVVWSRSLPGRAESSPVVYKGKVIFGCECNSVFALNAKTGKTVWQGRTSGAVKAPPAISDNKVYVADYAGKMYALSAVNGSKLWESSDQGSSLGRSGRFYSSPAVAFGRVYAGNVDGRVYSFATRNGDTAWSQSTGDWVYSGVAAGRAGKHGPAVFTGSFDNKAYALDARTGEVIWSADVGGRVSGAGSIVGDVFYVSVLAGKTIGLDTETGKTVFSFPKGQYNPVISDGHRIYLTGYSSITALEPKRKRGGGQGKGSKQGKRKQGKPKRGKPDGKGGKRKRR